MKDGTEDRGKDDMLGRERQLGLQVEVKKQSHLKHMREQVYVSCRRHRLFRYQKLDRRFGSQDDDWPCLLRSVPGKLTMPSRISIARR